ncbi:MAG TPA: DUF5615 family PIN-like protein [Thermoanaerobaculia bacterium]|nr:DUF5615 family PIN-like protein [Thermoanaerobaculia bacterium]
MIKLLFDMGLPRRAAADLRQDGLAVVHVGELGMAQAEDREILAMAEREQFTVVTLDSDFAKILVTEGRALPSVIHLRLPDLDREATVSTDQADSSSIDPGSRRRLHRFGGASGNTCQANPHLTPSPAWA